MTGILIVGAGPAGLTLAIDLAQRGVPCHVVEATEDRPVNPRCNTTSARSMEIFRRLGLADEIRRAGLPGDYPTSIQYRTTLDGEEIYRIDLPSAHDVLAGVGKEDWPTPEPQHRISQLYLEPILERHARKLPGLTLERGTRLVELRQHDDHVEAVVEAAGERRTVRCAYVVGCDGAHSTVRRQLGIRYEGVDAIRQFVSTFVRSPELGRLAAKDRAWTYWTYGRRPASLIAINGESLWLNHVAFGPDHDTEGEDPEQLLRESVGRPVEHEVLGVVRWTGRRLVAGRYRAGRVFLAGDAAHIWIPVGGFGMNAGIQDAATLGWMLAAVHHGWAPPERLAVTEPRRYSPDGFSFGYHYAGSPLVVGGEDHAEITMGDYQDRARPGFRLPHVWLDDGRSVLDVLGQGFTLLRTDPSVAVTPWTLAARDLGIPLTVVDLPGRYLAELLLVRPDQHVAWMGGADACPEQLISGVDTRGGGSNGFVSPVFDVMAGGYGAQAYHDGVDTGGRLIIPSARAPDVEMTEYLYPLVALWRREETDSGGPGRQRGGMSGSVCYVQHPDQRGTMSLVVSGTGKVANQNVGLAGGHPGNSQLDLVVRGVHQPQLAQAVTIPGDLGELGGEIEVLPCEGESDLGPGDALYLHWQAGGGYGDPLLRKPENVREDVRETRVSPAAAENVYGVVLRDGEVDMAATDKLRQKLRRRRASGAGLTGLAPIETPDLGEVRRLDDNLAMLAGGTVVCVHCGTKIGPLEGGAFVAGLARRDSAPTEAGPHIWHDPVEYVDAEVVFRQLFCPGCLTAVYSRVVPVDHPLPVDEYRSWT
jgi:2-polyprenyl-6-methoxyphenol hydroxylase-like FAD-dependent oxidoreductase